jgi:hypothetical protein
MLPQQPQGRVIQAQSLQPDPAQVDRIATRFVRDRKAVGMAGIPADVDRCYRTAKSSTATLDCVGLDFVASKRDAYNSGRFHVPPMEYFAAEALQARVGHAASQVGYTGDQILAYMSTTGMAAYQRGASL